MDVYEQKWLYLRCCGLVSGPYVRCVACADVELESMPAPLPVARRQLVLALEGDESS